MSVKAMTWAFEQPLPGNAKLLLLALADFANDDGECWPSIDRLTVKASMSRSTVKRMILMLADQGYLSTVAREADDGRSRSNLYLLHFCSERGGVQNEPLGVHSYEPGRGPIVNPLYEPSIEPSLKNISVHLKPDEDFDEFWKAYPKRAGNAVKSQASKTFLLKTKKVPAARIIEGAKRYAAFCDATGKTGSEYVMQARTWLNAEGWDEAYVIPESSVDPNQRKKLEALKTIEEINNGTYEKRQPGYVSGSGQVFHGDEGKRLRPLLKVNKGW